MNKSGVWSFTAHRALTFQSQPNAYMIMHTFEIGATRKIGKLIVFLADDDGSAASKMDGQFISIVAYGHCISSLMHAAAISSRQHEASHREIHPRPTH